MRIALPLFLVALLTLATSGCAATAPAARSRDVLRPPEENCVAEAALRHAMGGFDRADRATFVAYVLPCTPLTSQLVESLRDVTPLVTNSMTVSMEGGQAHERTTGAPVKLWMVRVSALSPDRATAEVAWYQGIGDSALYTIELARPRQEWVVVAQRSERLFDAAPGFTPVPHVAQQSRPLITPPSPGAATRPAPHDTAVELFADSPR